VICSTFLAEEIRIGRIATMPIATMRSN
jgi:hypothetical protein